MARTVIGAFSATTRANGISITKESVPSSYSSVTQKNKNYLELSFVKISISVRRS